MHTEKTKQKLREATLRQHREGRYKPAKTCPVCKCWIGKNHNCNEIKEKQRQRKLEKPTNYWLGKKRPEFGLLIKKLFEGKTFKDRFGEIRAKEIGNKISEGLFKIHKEKSFGFIKGHKSIMTDEIKEKIGKKNSINMLRLWQNKEYKELMLQKYIGQKGRKSYHKDKTYEEMYGYERALEIRKKIFNSWNRRPSTYENKLIEIINKYKLPYKYTGDFSFLIGYKNPDFINCNGEKIAIEIYNTSHKLLYYDSIEQYQIERINIFGKYGWKVIFLDETDLKDKNKILNKLNGE